MSETKRQTLLSLARAAYWLARTPREESLASLLIQAFGGEDPYAWN